MGLRSPKPLMLPTYGRCLRCDVLGSYSSFGFKEYCRKCQEEARGTLTMVPQEPEVGALTLAEGGELAPTHQVTQGEVEDLESVLF